MHHIQSRSHCKSGHGTCQSPSLASLFRYRCFREASFLGRHPTILVSITLQEPARARPRPVTRRPKLPLHPKRPNQKELQQWDCEALSRNLLRKESLLHRDNSSGKRFIPIGLTRRTTSASNFSLRSLLAVIKEHSC
jgi:hypothetical protein